MKARRVGEDEIHFWEQEAGISHTKETQIIGGMLAKLGMFYHGKDREARQRRLQRRAEALQRGREDPS